MKGQSDVTAKIIKAYYCEYRGIESTLIKQKHYVYTVLNLKLFKMYIT